MNMTTKLLISLILLLGLAGMPWADVRGRELLQALHTLARPLRDANDLAPLLDAVDDARLVLLGEASHGTREFYAWRDLLSRRLIREHGFSFIAIEGDWSTLLPLDRYVRHHPAAPASARAALLQVERWPRWVWANTALEALAEWLRAFNQGRPAGHRVAIHGIDLYAIWESLDALQAFYHTHLPGSAPRMRRLYRFLGQFRGDYRAYPDYVRRTRHSAHSVLAPVVEELAARYREAAPADRDLLFEALQHARVVESGERYLRLMPRPGPGSWNARAEHFDRTVARLLAHHGPGSRGIVWAHNTHIGDARATDMVRTGEVNLGQLARERHGADGVFALGFGTGTGSVLAARSWEGPRETMQAPPPRPDSLEAALLASGYGDRFLILDPAAPATAFVRRALPHRAIGVVFDPAREPWKNYIPTRLALRYDAFVFLPVTRALDPLHAE
ncbi:MAG: erythromycin esterase family protein [Chromatiaceae bacterium]|nr:erythromycin esterase family protein [Chromatiaceae bacterium]